MKCIQNLSIKSGSWILYLCAALLIQPALAQQVVMGGQYNVFDDLYIVATVPGDPEANCENLIATIGAVSAPSTIRLPPAIYDCGTNFLDIPSGVTLEGSGQFDTSIIGAAVSETGTFAVVNTNAEVNNLKMQTLAAGTNSLVRVVTLEPGSALKGVRLINDTTGNVNNGAVAINTSGTEEIVLSDVTIRVSNGIDFADGILIGSNVSVVPVTLNNVDVLATGAPISCAIFSDSSSPALSIRNSIVNGDTDGVTGGTPTLDIAHSQIVNGVFTGGTNRCFSVYDANFTALNPDCTTPLPF